MASPLREHPPGERGRAQVYPVLLYLVVSRLKEDDPVAEILIPNSLLAQASNEEDKPAARLARLRAASMTAQRRSEIARKAAKARWAKKKHKKK